MTTQLPLYKEMLARQSGAIALISVSKSQLSSPWILKHASSEFLSIFPQDIFFRPFEIDQNILPCLPSLFTSQLQQIYSNRQAEELSLKTQEQTYFYTITPFFLEETETEDFLFLQIKDSTNLHGQTQEKDNDSAMLRTLIEALPDNIYMKNRQSEFLICNSSTAQTMSAPSAEAIIGKTDADFLPTESSIQSRLDEERIFQTGRPILHKEECLLDMDGTKKWTLTTKLPLFDRDQNIIGIVGVGRDITESRAQEQKLKQTQSMLHLATTVSPILIGYFDLQQRLLYANASFCHWNNLRETEIPYLCDNVYNLRDILDGQNYIKILPQIEQCLEGEEAFFSGAFTFADTQSRSVNMHFIPTKGRDRRNKIDGFYLYAIDVSELDAVRTQAEMASHAKSQFLANMSHELRTPLNAILGFSEIMKSEAFGPLGNDRYIDYMHDIYDSGKHLLDVINDILDLSKIEAGKMELEFQHVDPLIAIDTALSFVQCRASDQSVRLIKHIPEQLPKITTDLRALKQVLINILANAIKFTPEQGHVTLEAQIIDGTFVITVTDNGVGMTEKQLQKIGEAFTQFKNEATKSRSLNGTGLGLYITKALLREMLGSFKINSTKDIGTTVAISLPLEIEGTKSILPPCEDATDNVFPLYGQKHSA